jgi:aspartyl-tRNA synthetase
MILTDYKKIDDSILGEEVTIGGFVNTIRDHGGLLFIDLRSFGNTIQTVINPDIKEVFEISKSIHNEYVLAITGILSNRSEETKNPKIHNGHIELVINKIEIVAKANTLPFDIHADNLANEELRLKYRYIDLRRAKLQDLLLAKHRFTLDIRNYFDKEGFVDVQTPILANSSPEGARDFLIPSRLHPGKFYALPQSPQQFKQLMMVGGFNKYFQIAPCFRDEDPRADRHPGDFYHIDAEIAWADEELVYNFSWDFINNLISKHTTKKLHPEFTKISYDNAMEVFGSDKPDFRIYQESNVKYVDQLGWLDSKSVFIDSGFEVFAKLCDKPKARVQALNIKNAVDKFTRSDLDKIQEIGRSFGLPGIAYFQFTTEGIKSPLLKFFTNQDNTMNKLTNLIDCQTGDLVLFLASEDKELIYKAQKAIRHHVADKLNILKKDEIRFVWVNDMPFFESDEKTGKIDFGHNPFGVFKTFEGKDEKETLDIATKENRLLELRAIQYDIACNGYEVLSGGKRNSNPELLMQAFKIVGYSEVEVKEKFGHMLEAYSYGAPYHAGFAWGLDRLFMVLNDETNIREIIAFPKNGQGMDLVMNSPSIVRSIQLKELNIELKKE